MPGDTSARRRPTTLPRRRGTSRWGSWSSGSPRAPPRRGGPVHRSRSPYPGLLTHGHLPENNNHGGLKLELPDAASMLSGPPTNNVYIKDFTYGRGDLALTGRAGRPPVVRRGKSLKFTNLDSLPGVCRRSARTTTRSRPASSPATAPRASRTRPRTRHPVRLEGARLRPPGFTRRRTATPGGRPGTSAADLHLLLPDPPVHARHLPRQMRRAIAAGAALAVAGGVAAVPSLGASHQDGLREGRPVRAEAPDDREGHQGHVGVEGEVPAQRRRGERSDDIPSRHSQRRASSATPSRSAAGTSSSARSTRPT